MKNDCEFSSVMCPMMVLITLFFLIGADRNYKHVTVGQPVTFCLPKNNGFKKLIMPNKVCEIYDLSNCTLNVSAHNGPEFVNVTITAATFKDGGEYYLDPPGLSNFTLFVCGMMFCYKYRNVHK